MPDQYPKRRAALEALQGAHAHLLAVRAAFLETSAMTGHLDAALNRVECAIQLLRDGGYVALRPDGVQQYIEPLPEPEEQLR